MVTILGPVSLGRRTVRLQLFLLDQVGQERHDGRGVQEEEVKQAEVAAYTKRIILQIDFYLLKHLLQGVPKKLCTKL